MAERAFATIERFLHIEAVGGIVLLIAAALALVWANSPAAHGYHALWHMPLSAGLGSFVFSQPLHFWINDALMTVFFLVVGMEIRREAHEGALSDPRQAALPMAAAMGGVAVPALIYLALNGEPARQHGWAVPTATDIAFAVGVLALLGRSIPGTVRVFLLALVAGKPLGAIGVSWLVVRLGWCRLAPGLSWGGICLVGLLAGVGFTMSIFIAMLAFSDENLLGAAKLGVLLGSLGAALLGLGWGLVYAKRLREQA
ncbi:hypothetical protein GCM10023144_02610 [Pigmentiphaga soli]|uniref:Na(+)/H(+) antiporter NhaA n=1 Tax=Pigmentiphaga soli TaxID=1007095 RepID=A0ABP8GDU3_9BURK